MKPFVAGFSFRESAFTWLRLSRLCCLEPEVGAPAA